MDVTDVVHDTPWIEAGFRRKGAMRPRSVVQSASVKGRSVGAVSAKLKTVAGGGGGGLGGGAGGSGLGGGGDGDGG